MESEQLSFTVGSVNRLNTVPRQTGINTRLTGSAVSKWALPDGHGHHSGSTQLQEGTALTQTTWDTADCWICSNSCGAPTDVRERQRRKECFRRVQSPSGTEKSAAVTEISSLSCFPHQRPWLELVAGQKTHTCFGKTARPATPRLWASPGWKAMSSVACSSAYRLRIYLYTGAVGMITSSISLFSDWSSIFSRAELSSSFSKVPCF